MNRLTDDQYFRLEALRLAVQAGLPELREAFYGFLQGSDGTALRFAADINAAVGDAIKQIEASRLTRGFGESGQ
jgi:hypothetical protein